MKVFVFDLLPYGEHLEQLVEDGELPWPLEKKHFKPEEAWEIIRRAWTEEVFSFEGRFWTYRDVAIWPRPVQQPHPTVWVPVTTSKETIEWAARNDIPITPGMGGRGLREDVTAYYARA